MNVKGRPKKTDAKDCFVKVRLTEAEDQKLAMICFETEKSRSEVVREALDRYFKIIKYE